MNLIKLLRAVLAGALVSVVPLAVAAPMLTIVKPGTSFETSDTIFLGTSTYTFDVRLDSSGCPVSTLQYSLYTDPANAVTYGPTPVTALNTPFTTADLAWQPAAGDTLNGSSTGQTMWAKASGDYNAFAGDIAAYQINTAGLSEGTYVFSFSHSSSEDQYLGWSGGEKYNSDFATPGSFTLNIIQLPEPGSCLLLGSGCVILWLKRLHSKQARKLPSTDS